MSLEEINAKLAAGAVVKICPWQDAFSNQVLVQVQSVAGNRTVTYFWEAYSGDEERVTKTAQVSYSTWRYIVETLAA